MSQTTIQYVLSRLHQLGITDIFGVPGDFAFPINDAICQDKSLRFIGSCNELNAAYAADGYARIKGMAAINTTYGPGELSALCGIAGSYAENLPIFHLTDHGPARIFAGTFESILTSYEGNSSPGPIPWLSEFKPPFLSVGRETTGCYLGSLLTPLFPSTLNCLRTTFNTAGRH